MTPAQYERVRELFLAAREQPPAERAAFLRQTCADDIELRAEVESRCATMSQPGRSLRRPHSAPSSSWSDRNLWFRRTNRPA